MANWANNELILYDKDLFGNNTFLIRNHSVIILIISFIIHHYLTDIILSWNNNDQIELKDSRNLRILILKGKEVKYHLFF